MSTSKGGFFFRKCNLFFKSPNLPKKIFQKTILDLKFKIPAYNSIMLWPGILNFKFRIVFWNIFFWRFGDLKKRIALSEKKPPLGQTKLDRLKNKPKQHMSQNREGSFCCHWTLTNSKSPPIHYFRYISKTIHILMYRKGCNITPRGLQNGALILSSSLNGQLRGTNKGALSIGKGQIYLVLYEYYVGSYQANISQ